MALLTDFHAGYNTIGLQIGATLISIIFYGFGIFTARGYHTMGLQVVRTICEFSLISWFELSGATYQSNTRSVHSIFWTEQSSKPDGTMSFSENIFVSAVSQGWLVKTAVGLDVTAPFSLLPSSKIISMEWSFFFICSLVCLVRCDRYFAHRCCGCGFTRSCDCVRSY